MTHEFTIDDTISTADEFESLLGELLSAATGNGFDPQGSWVFRSDDSGTDWEIMVVELETEASDN